MEKCTGEVRERSGTDHSVSGAWMLKAGQSGSSFASKRRKGMSRAGTSAIAVKVISACSPQDCRGDQAPDGNGLAKEGVIMNKMQGAIIIGGQRQVELKEFPVPEPGPGQVLLRMKAAGLCASDLHNIS